MVRKPVNEIKLKFPSLSVNEKYARLAISGFVGLYDPRIDELSDIKTAVSEAVTNCKSTPIEMKSAISSLARRRFRMD